ncbi:MAG: ATP-binding protein [Zavarzinella sp.]
MDSKVAALVSEGEFMFTAVPVTSMPRWDLAAEAIALRIRWFGLFLGFLYVNFGIKVEDRLVLDAILALGLIYTIMDSIWHLRGKVFFGEYPLVVSAMEALFIGILCFFEQDADSPFRFYYLLSLICCAIRHPLPTTYVTCLFHCFSYAVLNLALPEGSSNAFLVLLMTIVLVWLTWAASGFVNLTKQIESHLRNLNNELQEQQEELEQRIEDRTRQLQETQAQLLHQEKMAGFGLLAAGIAHEVGNPLMAISTIMQMLQRRDPEPYTKDKLQLVGTQLSRIQGILRELMNFSRPATVERTQFTIRDVVDEALGIAKYYRGINNRNVEATIAPNLPVISGQRDQFVQVIFNLVLNAIDATPNGGNIGLTANLAGENIQLTVSDNGCGIPLEEQHRLFQPYFTTKKQGTGLGLFICRKIMQEHGGTIQVTSTPGEGTRFELTIPAVAIVVPETEERK